VLETVRASFSAPRKTIRNALSHSLGIDSVQTVRALERAAIASGHARRKTRRAGFSETRDALRAELAGRIVTRNA